MNYRSAYIRRAKKGLRLKKRAAVVALLGVVACAAAALYQGEPTVQRLVHAGAAGAPAGEKGIKIAEHVESNGTRRIYPYSIVPGGVGDRTELARIVQADKVVAAHYASFEVDKAHPVTVAKPRFVHVSYRKGDQVYWTAQKVQLAEGETLLSDGHNEIRGRCGNRISETAMLPVEAAAPGEEELDAAVEEAPDGALNVAAPFDGTGTGQAYRLLSFPNGAGLLAVTGGEGWQAPASPFGSMAGGTYPGTAYGAPITLNNAGGQSASNGSAPAANTPVGTGAPADAPAGSEAAIATASSGGSTTETLHAGSAGTAPAGLPVRLTDTVQPEPAVDIKTPTLPDVLLSPGQLPTVPVANVEPTAQAPEPSSLWLGSVGIAAMCLLRRRRRAA